MTTRQCNSISPKSIDDVDGDITFAVDSQNDIGEIGTCVRTLYVDTIQGTTSTAPILSEGITIATTKKILPAVTSTVDLGAGDKVFEDAYIENIQGATSTAPIFTEGITIATTKKILPADSSTVDLGDATHVFEDAFIENIQGATSTAPIFTEGITIATTKKILPAVTSTVDLGAGDAVFEDAYIENLQGATSTAVNLSEGAVIATNKDILGAADGTSDVGSATVRMGLVAADLFNIAPDVVAGVKQADYTIAAGIMFVTLDAVNPTSCIATLPDATANPGRVIVCTWYDAADTVIPLLKSAGGTIQDSAGSAIAAATGVKAAADYTCAGWVSDATNWIMLFHTGSVVTA